MNKTAFLARSIFAKDIILWQLTKSLDQVRVVVLNRARRKGAHVRPGPVFSVVQPARLRLAVLSALLRLAEPRLVCSPFSPPG